MLSKMGRNRSRKPFGRKQEDRRQEEQPRLGSRPEEQRPSARQNHPGDSSSRPDISSPAQQEKISYAGYEEQKLFTVTSSPSGSLSSSPRPSKPPPSSQRSSPPSSLQQSIDAGWEELSVPSMASRQRPAPSVPKRSSPASVKPSIDAGWEELLRPSVSASPRTAPSTARPSPPSSSQRTAPSSFHSQPRINTDWEKLQVPSPPSSLQRLSSSYLAQRSTPIPSPRQSSAPSNPNSSSPAYSLPRSSSSSSSTNSQNFHSPRSSSSAPPSSSSSPRRSAHPFGCRCPTCQPKLYARDGYQRRQDVWRTLGRCQEGCRCAACEGRRKFGRSELECRNEGHYLPIERRCAGVLNCVCKVGCRERECTVCRFDGQGRSFHELIWNEKMAMVATEDGGRRD